jgi:hypothetical protein
MCLATVSKVHRPMLRKKVKAWKILQRVSIPIIGEDKEEIPYHYLSPFRNFSFREGVQVTRELDQSGWTERFISADDGYQYPNGFHAYKTQKDAKVALKKLWQNTLSSKYKTCKVYPVMLENILAEGTDGTAYYLTKFKNIIAQKLTLLPVHRPSVKRSRRVKVNQSK